MQTPITTKDTYRRPPTVVEPIRVVEPITTASLGRGRIANPEPEVRVAPPIITLADLMKNRKKMTPTRGKMRRPNRDDVWVDYGEDLKVRGLWQICARQMWKGRRCFIVGGGPSLKNFNWNLLDGELSIGINRAFEKYDPSMMFCMDPRVWGWIVRGDFGQESTERYESFKGVKVWMNATNFVFPDNIVVVDLADLQPCGSNSGHGAINLAILLGANPIYLLGFDMKGDGSGHQKWFHNGYPALQSESVYGGFIEALGKDVARIKKSGTKVINLTPDSALNCFNSA